MPRRSQLILPRSLRSSDCTAPFKRVDRRRTSRDTHQAQPPEGVVAISSTRSHSTEVATCNAVGTIELENQSIRRDPVNSQGPVEG